MFLHLFYNVCLFVVHLLFQSHKFFLSFVIRERLFHLRYCLFLIFVASFACRLHPLLDLTDLLDLQLINVLLIQQCPLDVADPDEAGVRLRCVEASLGVDGAAEGSLGFCGVGVEVVFLEAIFRY